MCDAILSRADLFEFRRCVIESGYHQNLTTIDKSLRHCDSPQDCMQKYLDDIRLLEHNERIMVEKAVIRANDLTMMSYKTLYKLPWKIVVSQGSAENRFPHTHGDFIVLPVSFFKGDEVHDWHVKTLIHEKCHVFQRLYPIECHILFTRFWGMQLRGIDAYNAASKRRSNPDINRLVYAHNGDNVTAVYRENAQSIGDVDGLDHPLEIMAYMVADMAMGSSLQHYDSKLVNGMRSWFVLSSF